MGYCSFEIRQFPIIKKESERHARGWLFIVQISQTHPTSNKNLSRVYVHPFCELYSDFITSCLPLYSRIEWYEIILSHNLGRGKKIVIKTSNAIRDKAVKKTGVIMEYTKINKLRFCVAITIYLNLTTILGPTIDGAFSISTFSLSPSNWRHVNIMLRSSDI